MAETDDLPAIPNYRLLRVLGEGGMGIVYDAEQIAPMRRRVALKLLKVGMDTKEFLGRFEAERQALAMMNDPAIATVYDAGATSTGRPFYAMEYVAGSPITEFCDANRLSVAARVDLVRQVCLGVQHAHEKGVVHRDLKPSNVLVAWHNEKAVAKIIDFGIAKAMTGRLSDRTFATQFGHAIGTPAYMSPEQWDAGSGDIDGRTDVYSLGVILYELLVGRLPFEPASGALDGVLISSVRRDTQPPTPSQRLKTAARDQETIARFRQTDPGSLLRDLRRDLDWITLHALEADRMRRYPTAKALADDLGRYLLGEPVVARPPSLAYRVPRWIRRNRVVVIAASLSVVLMGITAMAIMAAQTKQKAYIAMMKSDLKNLVVAEETWYATHGAYVADLAQLGYRPSDEVRVAFYQVKPEQWTGTATHPAVPQFRCMVTVGERTAVSDEGEPVCVR